MSFRLASILMAAAIVVSIFEAPAAEADGYHAKRSYKHRTVRRGGYFGQIGGYSYSKRDVTNLGGWMRGYGVLGRTSRYTQSPGGPFDTGFWFDPGLGPIGGNSRYLQ